VRLSGTSISGLGVGNNFKGKGGGRRVKRFNISYSISETGHQLDKSVRAHPAKNDLAPGANCTLYSVRRKKGINLNEKRFT
jgi:hypothetical protein